MSILGILNAGLHGILLEPLLLGQVHIGVQVLEVVVVHILHAVHILLGVVVDQCVGLIVVGHVHGVIAVRGRILQRDVVLGILHVDVIVVQLGILIDILHMLVVGIQGLDGGVHVQGGIAVVRYLALEGVGLLDRIGDLACAAVLVKNLELLLQGGHLIVSGGDGEIGGVSVLHAVLLHAILEIGGVVQLDVGVVAVFLVGGQLHVIGILDGGIVELSPDWWGSSAGCGHRCPAKCCLQQNLH